MVVPALPDLNELPPDALRALLLRQHEQLVSTQEQLQSREREIEHLKLLLAKLHRMQFGRKSEKLTRQIEQLELRLEELQADRGERPIQPDPPPTTVGAHFPAKPSRRALPDHLLRETRTYIPKEAVCPDCQGELRKLSEDVSEVLEYVPEQIKVIRYVRPKLSCRQCERIVQAPAPSRPIARGAGGAGSAGACAGLKVCRSSSSVPAMRDL